MHNIVTTGHSSMFQIRVIPSMLIRKLIFYLSYCSELEWMNIWAVRRLYAEPTQHIKILIFHWTDPVGLIHVGAACIDVNHSRPVCVYLPAPSLVAWWAWRRWWSCAPTASSRSPRWSRPVGPGWPGKPSAVWGRRFTQRRQRVKH